MHKKTARSNVRLLVNMETPFITTVVRPVISMEVKASRKSVFQV